MLAARHVVEPVAGAAGPHHLHRAALRQAEAEERLQGVLGGVAGAADDRLAARRHALGRDVQHGTDAAAVHRGAAHQADGAQRAHRQRAVAVAAAIEVDDQPAVREAQAEGDEVAARRRFEVLGVDGAGVERRAPVEVVVLLLDVGGDVVGRHADHVGKAVAVEVGRGRPLHDAPVVGGGHRLGVAPEVRAAALVLQHRPRIVVEDGVDGGGQRAEVDDVGVAVVVVVHGHRRPAERRRPQLAGAGIVEGAVRLAEEPARAPLAAFEGEADRGVAVVAEVGGEDVQVAVAVEVGERQAHPGARRVGADVGGDVVEVAGAVVLEDVDVGAVRLVGGKRRLVVGVQQVEVAVLVEVDQGDGPGQRRSFGDRRTHAADAADAGGVGDVRPAVAAQVVEQLVGVALRIGDGEDGLAVGPVEAVGDRHVEQAVVVDVAHRARGVAVGAAAQAAVGDLDEGPVAAVLEEAVGLDAAEHQQVVVAVVVGVAEADAGGVLGRRLDAGLGRHLAKADLAAVGELVGVEDVGGAGTVGDVDVDVAVAVVVEQRHPGRPARLLRRQDDVAEVHRRQLLEPVLDGDDRRAGAPVVDAGVLAGGEVVEGHAALHRLLAGGGGHRQREDEEEEGERG